MLKTFLLAGMALCLSFAGKAQVAKSIYAELGGPGFASINFDSRFSSKSQGGLGGRIGVGGFSSEGATLLFFPVGLNYLIGNDKKNYFEVGAGATFVRASADFVDDDKPYNGSFGHLTLGYRLQPEKSGFTFRAAITPIFGGGTFWPYWGGVSFGYKF
jgi:hypothetical protein